MFFFSLDIMFSFSRGNQYFKRKKNHQNLLQNKICGLEKIRNHQILSFVFDFEFCFPDICIQCFINSDLLNKLLAHQNPNMLEIVLKIAPAESLNDIITDKLLQRIIQLDVTSPCLNLSLQISIYKIQI